MVPLPNMPPPAPPEQPVLPTQATAPTHPPHQGKPASSVVVPQPPFQPEVSSGPEDIEALSPHLREAATSGDVDHLRLAEIRRRLVGVTPLHNTALHISTLFGHENLANLLAGLEPKLLSFRNRDGDTPLHLTAAAGHGFVVSSFIRTARAYELSQGEDTKGFTKQLLLIAGQNGGTPLHEAMRHGHVSVAKELLHECPEASEIVDKLRYSVLYLAALKESLEMVRLLLNIPTSSHAGPEGDTAMYPAVESNNVEIGRALLEKRPEFCTFLGQYSLNPLHVATWENKMDMVKLILEFDESAMYALNQPNGWTPIHSAAKKGYVTIIDEFIRRSPDAGLVVDDKHQNILHIAITNQRLELVKYILKTAMLSTLINQRDKKGNAPLHLAVIQCNPDIVRLLLEDDRVDKRATNMYHQTAWDVFYATVKPEATIDWNETFMLLGEADRFGYHQASHDQAKKAIDAKLKKQIQDITRTYVSNTSLISALIATVTFAAAFTMPGGFVNDNNDPDKGSPILIHRFALKAFIISDAIAMCCSLVVTFVCIYATWEDVRYLLQYRSSTKMLMWLALAALNVSFATGMYVVLAPKALWLAIFVCVLCFCLPLFTFALANWQLLQLAFRLRKFIPKDLVRIP